MCREIFVNSEIIQEIQDGREGRPFVLANAVRGVKNAMREQDGREGRPYISLFANTKNSALIGTNEFFGAYLDQRGFAAASCIDNLSFHHSGINQEHRLIAE